MTSTHHAKDRRREQTGDPKVVRSAPMSVEQPSNHTAAACRTCVRVARHLGEPRDVRAAAERNVRPVRVSCARLVHESHEVGIDAE
jgi:hypothetical protein